jgi:inositol polyphosphate 5-phosphatase INPP5E
LTNGLENGNRTFSSTANLSVKEAKSRSFLVGSLSAINGKGLLSTEELDRHLVDRRAKVLIATWNMGGVKKYPDNLDELIIPEMIQTLPEIFVIGVQEFDLNRKDWEIKLQEQIGPSHVKLSSYYAGSIGINLFIKRELIWFTSGE